MRSFTLRSTALGLLIPLLKAAPTVNKPYTVTGPKTSSVHQRATTSSTSGRIFNIDGKAQYFAGDQCLVAGTPYEQ
jgi:hypothetical protein